MKSLAWIALIFSSPVTTAHQDVVIDGVLEKHLEEQGWTAATGKAPDSLALDLEGGFEACP